MWYFGKPHSAPVYIEDGYVSAPVDQACAWCEEPIKDGDDGFVLPYLSADDEEETTVPYHRACLLRTIFGSLAHAQRKCSCYIPGATCTDPPEMTLREGAEAVLKYMERA